MKHKTKSNSKPQKFSVAKQKIKTMSTHSPHKKNQPNKKGKIMSFREEVLNLRVKEILKHSEDYDFPDFLKAIRKSLGFTRGSVAKNLCVTQSKIHNVEFGRYKRPDYDFILTLSHFYGISPKFTEKRLNEYLRTRKAI